MTTIVVNRACIVADRKLLVSGEQSTLHYTDGAKVHRSSCGTFAYATTGMDFIDADNRDIESLLRTVVTHTCVGGNVRDDEFKEVFAAVRARIVKPTLILTRKNFISIIKGIINVATDSADFFTVGTGGTFALAAMMAGYTPKAAVEFACEHEEMTGGPVDVIRATSLKAIKVS